MKSFNLTYKNFIKNIILEGGNAFSDVSRIKLNDIQKVIDKFKKEILDEYLSFDSSKALFLLGSTGKKKDSGDIDIGFDLNYSKDPKLQTLLKLNEICSEKGYPSYINTMTLDMLHVDFPQPINEKKVQIDLLATEYPDFAKFFMFYASPEMTKYKSAHRNELFHSILLIETMKNMQYDKNGDLVKWEQLDIGHDGVSKISKTLVDEKGNRLKYKNTNENLWFNYAVNIYSIDISHDIKEAISLMFGWNYSVEDISTFEKVFNIIKNDNNFKYKADRDVILKKCAENIKYNKNLEFPKELEEFI